MSLQLLCKLGNIWQQDVLVNKATVSPPATLQLSPLLTAPPPPTHAPKTRQDLRWPTGGWREGLAPEIAAATRPPLPRPCSRSALSSGWSILTRGPWAAVRGQRQIGPCQLRDCGWAALPEKQVSSGTARGFRRGQSPGRLWRRLGSGRAAFGCPACRGQARRVRRRLRLHPELLEGSGSRGDRAHGRLGVSSLHLTHRVTTVIWPSGWHIADAPLIDGGLTGKSMSLCTQALGSPMEPPGPPCLPDLTHCKQILHPLPVPPPPPHSFIHSLNHPISIDHPVPITRAGLAGQRTRGKGSEALHWWVGCKVVGM